MRRGQHELRRNQRARANGVSIEERVNRQVHHERIFGRLVNSTVGNETLSVIVSDRRVCCDDKCRGSRANGDNNDRQLRQNRRDSHDTHGNRQIREKIE